MLTREKALQKHREMWTAMQKELGDNPSFIARVRFKIKWCVEHGDIDIDCHCYLCEYTEEHGLECNECPIDWGDGCGKGKTNYGHSPISEILALPERKVEENGMVAETES